MLDFLQRWRQKRSVTGADLAFLFRSLAAMMNSGVGLDRALTMLAGQQGSPALQQACQRLADRVCSGRYLSNAMSLESWLFSKLHLRLVAVGEKTGQMHICLSQLAELQERQMQIELKVRGALTVPLIICSLCLLMVVLAPPLLFRSLLTMLVENGASLPWPTKILMLLSDALRNPLSYVVALIASVAFAKFLSKLSQDPARKLVWLRRIRQLPILGSVQQLISLTRFVQALQILNRVGIPVLQALEYASQATADPCLVADVAPVVEMVRDGETLGHAFLQCEGFPDALGHSLAAGEESGKLGDMLEALARLYACDLEHSLEILTKSLEPLLLGFVGCVVAFTVVATMLPMLKVMDSL